MEISHRATQALITGAIGIVAVVRGPRCARLLVQPLRKAAQAARSDGAWPAGARRSTSRGGWSSRSSRRVGDLERALALRRDLARSARRCSPRAPCSLSSPGLAFSTPLSNLGSGLLVAFTQPLRLGDRVSVGGETGFVEEMGLIYTTLVTDDARRIFIPNTQLTTSMIVNRTIKDPRRIVSARVPVAIATPIDEARACSSRRSPSCRARSRLTRGSGSARSAIAPSGSTLRPTAPIDADVVDARERTPRARPRALCATQASSQAERKRRVASRRNGRPRVPALVGRHPAPSCARTLSGPSALAGAGAASAPLSRGR